MHGLVDEKKNNETSECADSGPEAVILKRRRITEIVAIVALILLPFIAYWPVTTGFATFAGFDHTGINQPLKQEAFESIRSGELPLWDYRLDRGLPFFAEGEAGIFYPLNWMFLIPGDFLAIYNLVLLLCLVTGALLFYLWIRRLGAGPLPAFLASVAFQWSATMNFNKANMNILEGYILAPLMMLLIEPTAFGGNPKGRAWLRTAGIGAVFAAIIFAGQAQYVAYTGLFASVYIILRALFAGRAGFKPTIIAMGVPFLLGAILGAGLSAVQLFSTLELIPLSERGADALSKGFAVRGLWMSPSRLFATFIFPAYHVSLDHFLPYLATTVYVGPVVLLLASYASRKFREIKSPAVIPLLIAGLIFLWLSMGSNAPVSGWITSHGPLASFRGHGRFGGYFSLAFIALSGLGLDLLLRKPCVATCDMIKRKCLPLFTFEFVAMALLTIPFIVDRALYVETRTSLILFLTFIILFITGFLVGNLVRSRQPVAIVIILCLAIQVIGFQATSSETILMRSSWDTDRADLLFIAENERSPLRATSFAIRTQASVRIHDRVLERGLQAFEFGSHTHIDHLGSANAGIMEDLVICNADLPLELGRWEWLVHKNAWPLVDFTDGMLPDTGLSLLYIIGLNWIVTENGNLQFPSIVSYEEEIPQFIKHENPEWTNRDVPYYIYQRETPVPPYQVFWNWTGVPGNMPEDEFREAFMEFVETEDVKRVAFIEGIESGETDADETGSSNHATVLNASWVSNTEFEVLVTDVSSDGIFMFRDGWYPGWKVYVNGVEKELLRADGVYKAVRINAGRNQVVFRYEPRYLSTGWIVSGISLVLLLLPLSGPLRRYFAKFKRKSATPVHHDD